MSDDSHDSHEPHELKELDNSTHDDSHDDDDDDDDDSHKPKPLALLPLLPPIMPSDSESTCASGAPKIDISTSTTTAASEDASGSTAAAPATMPSESNAPYFVTPTTVLFLLVSYAQLYVLSSGLSLSLPTGPRQLAATLAILFNGLVPWPGALDSSPRSSASTTGWEATLAARPLRIAPSAAMPNYAITLAIVAVVAVVTALAWHPARGVARGAVFYALVGGVGPAVHTLAAEDGTGPAFVLAILALVAAAAAYAALLAVLGVLPAKYTNFFLLEHSTLWNALRPDVLDPIYTSTLTAAALLPLRCLVPPILVGLLTTEGIHTAVAPVVWLVFEVALAVALLATNPFRSTLYLCLHTAQCLALILHVALAWAATDTAPILAWLSVAVFASLASVLLGYTASTWMIYLCCVRGFELTRNNPPLFWVAARSGRTKANYQAAKANKARANARANARAFDTAHLQAFLDAHTDYCDALDALVAVAGTPEDHDTDAIAARYAEANAAGSHFVQALGVLVPSLRSPHNVDVTQKLDMLADARVALADAVTLDSPPDIKANATLAKSLASSCLSASSSGLFAALIEENLPPAICDTNLALHDAVLSTKSSLADGNVDAVRQGVTANVAAINDLIDQTSAAMAAPSAGAAARSRLITVRAKLVQAREALVAAAAAYYANPDNPAAVTGLNDALDAVDHARTLATMELSTVYGGESESRSAIDRGGLVFASSSAHDIAGHGSNSAIAGPGSTVGGSAIHLSVSSPLFESLSLLAGLAHKLLSVSVTDYAATLSLVRDILAAATTVFNATNLLLAETLDPELSALLRRSTDALSQATTNLKTWCDKYEADPVNPATRADILPMAASLIANIASTRAVATRVYVANLALNIATTSLQLERAMEASLSGIKTAIAAAPSGAAGSTLAFESRDALDAVHQSGRDVVRLGEDLDTLAQKFEVALPDPTSLQLVYQARSAFMVVFLKASAGIKSLEAQVRTAGHGQSPDSLVIVPTSSSSVLGSLTSNLYELHLARDRLILTLSDVNHTILDTRFSPADASLSHTLKTLRTEMVGGASMPSADQVTDNVAYLSFVSRNMRLATEDPVIHKQFNDGVQELEFSHDTLVKAMDAPTVPETDRGLREISAALDGVAAARVALFAVAFKVEASFLAAQAGSLAQATGDALVGVAEASLNDVDKVVISNAVLKECVYNLRRTVDDLRDRRSGELLGNLASALDGVLDAQTLFDGLFDAYLDNPILGAQTNAEPLRSSAAPHMEAALSDFGVALAKYTDYALADLSEVLEMTSGNSVSLNASFARANFADVRKTVALSQDLLRTITILEDMLDKALKALTLPVLRDVLNGLANQVAFTKASINQGIGAYEANPADPSARTSLRAAQASMSKIRREVFAVTSVAAIIVDLVRETGTASKLAASMDSSPLRKFFSSLVGLGRVAIDHLELAGVLGFSSKRLASTSPSLRSSSAATPRSIVKSTATNISRVRASVRAVAKTDAYSTHNQEVVEAARTLTQAMRSLATVFNAFVATIDTRSQEGASSAGSGSGMITSEAMTTTTQKLLDGGTALVEAMAVISNLFSKDSLDGSSVATLLTSQRPVLRQVTLASESHLKRLLQGLAVLSDDLGRLRKTSQLASVIRKASEIEDVAGSLAAIAETISSDFNLKFFRIAGAARATALRDSAAALFRKFNGTVAMSADDPRVSELRAFIDSVASTGIDAHYYVAHAGMVIDAAHIGVVASSSRFLDSVSQAHSALFSAVNAMARAAAVALLNTPSADGNKLIEVKRATADMSRAISGLGVAGKTISRFLSDPEDQKAAKGSVEAAISAARTLSSAVAAHASQLRAVRVPPYAHLPASDETDEASPSHVLYVAQSELDVAFDGFDASLAKLLQDQRAAVSQMSQMFSPGRRGGGGAARTAAEDALSPRSALGAAFAEMRHAGGSSNDMSNLTELLYEALVEAEMDVDEAIERMSDFDNMQAVALAGVDAMDASGRIMHVLRSLVLFAFDPMVLEDLRDAQAGFDAAFAALSSAVTAVRDTPSDRSLVPLLRRAMNALVDAKDIVVHVASLPANVADLVRGSALASALAAGTGLSESKRSVFVTVAELTYGISQMLRGLDAPLPRIETRSQRLKNINADLVDRVEAVDVEEQEAEAARAARRHAAEHDATVLGVDVSAAGASGAPTPARLSLDTSRNDSAAGHSNDDDDDDYGEPHTPSRGAPRILVPLVTHVVDHADAVIVEAMNVVVRQDEADDALDILIQHIYNLTRAVRSMSALANSASGAGDGTASGGRTIARALADAHRRILAAVPRLSAEGQGATTQTKAAAYDALDALRTTGRLLSELHEATDNGLLAARLTAAADDVDAAVKQLELAVKNIQYAPSSSKAHSLLEIGADAARDVAGDVIPMGIAAAGHVEVAVASLSVEEGCRHAASNPVANFLDQVYSIARNVMSLVASSAGGTQGALTNELRRLAEGMTGLEAMQEILAHDRLEPKEGKQVRRAGRVIHATVDDIIIAAHGVVTEPRSLDAAMAMDGECVRFAGDVDDMLHMLSGWDEASGARSVVGVGLAGNTQHRSVPGSRIDAGGYDQDQTYEALQWDMETTDTLHDILDAMENECERVVHGVKTDQVKRVRAATNELNQLGERLLPMLRRLEKSVTDIVVQDRLFMAHKRCTDAFDRLRVAQKYYLHRVDTHSRRRLMDACKSLLSARRYVLEATSRKPKVAVATFGTTRGGSKHRTPQARRKAAQTSGTGSNRLAASFFDVAAYSPWSKDVTVDPALLGSPWRRRTKAQTSRSSRGSGEPDRVRLANMEVAKYEARLRNLESHLSGASSLSSAESRSGSTSSLGDGDETGEPSRQQPRARKRVSSWQRGNPITKRGGLLVDMEALPPIGGAADPTPPPPPPAVSGRSSGGDDSGDGDGMSGRTRRRARKHRPHVSIRKLQGFEAVFTEVTTELFLGGIGCAQDVKLLRKHRITHIVNVAGGVVPNYYPEEFTYKRYSLQNTPSEDIYSILYDVVEFIQGAVEDGGRVFVHCMQGSSRSASLVLGYLMWRDGLSYDDAFRYVRYLRAVCNPNPGFEAQLREWWDHMMGGPSARVNSLYSVVQHNPNDRSVIVGKVVKHELMRSSMGPRNCFILVAPNDDVVYLWQGLRVADAYVRRAYHVIAQLQYYEGAPDAVVEVTQGDEDEAFWSALMSNQLGSSNP